MLTHLCAPLKIDESSGVKRDIGGLWAIDMASQKTIDGIVFVDDGSSEIRDGWGIDSASPYQMVSASFPSCDYSKTSKNFCWN